MKQIKKMLMLSVMSGMLMMATSGIAGSSTKGKWLNVGVSTASMIYGTLTTFFGGGDAVWMVAVNIDPAQLVTEYLVLDQMGKIKDDWDPEPAEEYEQAAQNNGGGGGGSQEGPTYETNIQKLPFLVASLQNVGIESIGIGPDLSEIAETETRKKILSDLAGLQPKDSSATGTATVQDPSAGSCTASYSVCFRDMTTEEENTLTATQKVNEQDFGTAGIAHAELGLKSVAQAMANDGSVADTAAAGISSEEAGAAVTIGQTKTVQDLSSLIGTGANTVVAMKIVALMNLELAGRLNQGNMLQGSALTIEAARAFPQASKTVE